MISRSITTGKACSKIPVEMFGYDSCLFSYKIEWICDDAASEAFAEFSAALGHDSGGAKAVLQGWGAATARGWNLVQWHESMLLSGQTPCTEE